MFMTLLAAAAAGLGAAGIGIALRKLSGNRIGKWIIPASAGLGILLYQISFEYSWFDNQMLHKPESAVLVAVENQPFFLRPWTYLFPLTTAYTLIEPNDIQYQEIDQPNYAKLARFYLYRIEKAPADIMKHRQHVLNCTTGELVQLKDNHQIDENVKIRTLNDQDRLYRQVCG